MSLWDRKKLYSPTSSFSLFFREREVEKNFIMSAIQRHLWVVRRCCKYRPMKRPVQINRDPPTDAVSAFRNLSFHNITWIGREPTSLLARGAKR
ncbi:hypothetical protein TNIN_470051 [Trichonephila inaurata madagascariensis]|uniref:Uncharacterized protein n=1 Tax=Trichonephila inaurata madagascariensis TaxID=2747483 RepID=A0A8X6Y8Y9_9ARAC|nr:hypothetical protein TNIN_470051 [Trichonephila inaurata madagascariensis]